MIGVIVDGPGDFASLRARFSGTMKVRKATGPRGHTVTIAQLLSSARRQVRQLALEGCDKVLLLFDYEMRTERYADFIRTAQAEADRQSFAVPVVVCAANRMIENWYLADVEELSRRRVYIRPKLRQRNFEGLHGKDELKKLLRSNIKYDEIGQGRQLFCTIRLEVAGANSPSLQSFLTALP